MASNPVIEQVMQALARGDKLAAVQLLRQSSGMSLGDVARSIARLEQQLVESNATVADLEQTVAKRVMPHAKTTLESLKANKRTPTVVVGETPGSLRRLLLVVVVIAIVGWFLFD